jgi:hypothetical protein
MQLVCVNQTFHEPLRVERLVEEIDRSVFDRTSSVFVVWVCGNQNHPAFDIPATATFPATQARFVPAVASQ